MESKDRNEHDEHLSQTTARLSISIKEEGVLSQVREFLQDQKLQRRDSAVSITSLEENDIRDTSEQPQSLISTKRRRSSVQTVPPPRRKKAREHKRKARKQNASLTIELQGPNNKIVTHSITHLREFLLEALQLKKTSPRQLLMVTKPMEVTKIVVAIVPGLLLSDFDTIPSRGAGGSVELESLEPDGKHNETLPFFPANFEYLLPTTMATSQDSIFPCPQALVSFPVSKAERKRRAEESRAKKIVLYDLLVTIDQMRSNNYPVHSSLDENSHLEDGWVETGEFDHEGSHTFALDCEFCQAKSGPVLTRASMVNFQNEVIYDTFVKPEEEITDYVTRYSGITAEALKDVTTTAKDVQKKILELVSSSDILIGHSLESDLNVMKIRHPNIIDTALIYDHNQGPPSKPGLRSLAAQHLNRKIQQGEQTGEGHSSVEDSRACLDLVKMKLLNGPGFGKVIRETTLFEKLYESSPSKRSVIIDFSPEIYGHDLGERVNLEKFTVVNDDEVVETLERELESSTLAFIRFKEMDFNSGVVQVPSRFTGKLYSELDENRKSAILTGENRNDCLKSLNNRLQKVYDQLPVGCVFVVCNEGGDTMELTQLQGVRKRFRQLERKQVKLSDIPPEDCWDFDKQTALKRACVEASNGFTFATVITDDNSE